ncbi:hemin-degrading factor [Nitrosococcus wardiae]|uniref:Hemin-degrading factor n=1 Tax=Nitrosococcus wardiae TaxID=1814290 RepID=A0A4P7C184_9GAMM|nr:ChuX/HutX family heme-like substrate-binding protein [Nitrosococcus wardiae]QBQ55204.1 hemin-degrading factor [Nitrosococcus wardiae]
MLRTQWRHDQEKPRVCLPRKAAHGDVSEVEVLAASCGKTVTRLCGLRDLIKELPQLGKVRVVTGNRHVVQEKVSQYQAIKLFDSHGRVQGDAIDLRLFLNHWHYGFAVKEKWDDGFRHSLQFFDRDGVGVHKVYLTRDSHWEAYENLIAYYRSADQRPRQSVAPVPRPLFCADEEIDMALLRQSWCALQDIHDLPALFKNFGMTRIQGLRLVGADLATPVVLPDLQVFMKVLRETALPLSFHVGNGGVVQIHTGMVKQVGITGLWLTALDTDFTLYLRGTGIASAWILRKPGEGGTLSCLELYNWAGENVLQIFSPSQPGQVEYGIWQGLLAALETASISECSLLLTG